MRQNGKRVKKINAAQMLSYHLDFTAVSSIVQRYKIFIVYGLLFPKKVVPL